MEVNCYGNNSKAKEIYLTLLTGLHRNAGSMTLGPVGEEESGNAGELHGMNSFEKGVFNSGFYIAIELVNNWLTVGEDEGVAKDLVRRLFKDTFKENENGGGINEQLSEITGLEWMNQLSGEDDDGDDEVGEDDGDQMIDEEDDGDGEMIDEEDDGDGEMIDEDDNPL
jgi:hypothetical protein